MGVATTHPLIVWYPKPASKPNQKVCPLGTDLLGLPLCRNSVFEIFRGEPPLIIDHVIIIMI